MTSPDKTWQDRALVAVARIGPDDPSQNDVLVEVGLRFADLFGPGDREFVGLADRPLWHSKVIEALAALRAAELVDAAQVPAIAANPAARERHATQLAFDAAHYDSLRILTTELKRILRDGGDVEVRLSRRRVLSGARLSRVLRVV